MKRKKKLQDIKEDPIKKDIDFFEEKVVMMDFDNKWIQHKQTEKQKIIEKIEIEQIELNGVDQLCQYNNILEQCKFCKRKFDPYRIEKHESVCNKNKRRKSLYV